MVIYYRLAFDHKLLNLKNIIGTETELCIHLHLFRQQIFSEGLLRPWGLSQAIWHVKEGGVHVRRDRSSLWASAAFHKPSVRASPVGSVFLVQLGIILSASELGGPLGNRAPPTHSRPGKDFQ